MRNRVSAAIRAFSEKLETGSPSEIAALRSDSAACPVNRLAKGAGFAGLLIAVLSAFAAPAHAQSSTDLVQRSALRVCADPANMPFSNKAREGFENKLAELLAKSLGVPVTYTWFPQAIGFVRNTLRVRSCDVIIGFSQGHELVLGTNAYYRSVYVLLHRAGSDLEGVDNLGDPRLRDKKIGVIAGTPPATILAVNGLIGKAKPYHLMVDRRFENPAEEMLNDLAARRIDAGLLWGPIGGYYAKQRNGQIRVVPLLKEKSGPRMAFRIIIGVRPGEIDWKHQLNAFIETHQKEINAILLDYGVPLVDEKDRLIAQP
jgi:quinoprotein dehydrogenase-associated probable ABC transporter substrate-binding protein